MKMKKVPNFIKAVREYSHIKVVGTLGGVRLQSPRSVAAAVLDNKDHVVLNERCCTGLKERNENYFLVGLKKVG